jgi:hypothetical protein
MNRRTLLTLPIAAAAAQPPPERLRAFGLQWRAPIPSDWRVRNEAGGEVLDLLVARPQQANPRRPFQYALAETQPLARFTLQVEVRRQPKTGSLILVYAWRDSAHFNYLHLSDDAASRVPVHNGVFHCYGGDRVRISSTEGASTLPTEGWHAVRMSYDASAGTLEAWVDGRTSPSLKAVDLSLGAGLIGVGSFFNTGSFRGLKLMEG